jgi:DNA-binding transcriptional LysR family regulator
MLVKLFAEAAVTPSYVQHVTQIHSMLGLVRSGLAAAIVPEAAKSLHMTDVHLRTIRTTPVAPAELLLAWHRENENPALDVMRQLCFETLL